MSFIVNYKKAKYNFIQSKQWFELIGQPYSGGGGGIGKVHSVSIGCGDSAPTIYHQAYNGATNYHYMPIDLKPYVETIIKNDFKGILEKAFKLYEKDLSDLAELAKKEYDDISKDIIKDFV